MMSYGARQVAPGREKVGDGRHEVYIVLNEAKCDSAVMLNLKNQGVFMFLDENVFRLEGLRIRFCSSLR